ncbi:hypothetical protein [Streptomyces sp. NPDC059224]|uniref:hypothetical protein n=1 Tax=Streptomyces sp. NPDC059224 TaxID=3346775 RepID=UPI0036B2B4D0
MVPTGREPHTPVIDLENDLGPIVQGTRGGPTSAVPAPCSGSSTATNWCGSRPFGTGPRTWERSVYPAIAAGTADAIRDPAAVLRTGRRPVPRAWHAPRGAELIFVPLKAAGPHGGFRCRWTAWTTP